MVLQTTKTAYPLPPELSLPCRTFSVRPEPPNSASKLCYPVLPLSDTHVWSEGSTPLELAESIRNWVAVGRRVPESNSMCVHAPSLVSRPPAHNQHEGSILRPVCADTFVSLLFKTCIASAICPSSLDVPSYSCQKVA
jgi:hypothetical protein